MGEQKIYWGIDRLKQWTEQNTSARLLSDRFIGSDVGKMAFQCHCGAVFQETWRDFRYYSEKRECWDCHIRKFEGAKA